MSRVQTVSHLLTFVCLPCQWVVLGQDVYWSYIVCFISSAALVKNVAAINVPSARGRIEMASVGIHVRCALFCRILTKLSIC